MKTTRLAAFLIIALCIGFGSATSLAIDCNDTVPQAALELLLETKFSKFSERHKKYHEEFGPTLYNCPEPYFSRELNASQKENLKELFIKNQLEEIPKKIKKNFGYIDIEPQLAYYQRIHKLVYGDKTILPADYQALVYHKAEYEKIKSQNCGDHEVDTTYLGPIHNQGSTSWCVGFATADLYSWHAKQQVSAIDAMILNNNYSKLSNTLVNSYQVELDAKKNSTDPKEIRRVAFLKSQFSDTIRDLADPGEALQVALDKGVCSEKDMPTTNMNLVELGKRRIGPMTLQAEIKSKANLVKCSAAFHNTSSIFPKLNEQQLLDVVEKANPGSLGLALRNENCKSVVNLPNKKVVNIVNQPFPLMLKTLQQQLSKKQPAAVGFRLEMIETKPRSVEQGGLMGHVATVIGSRYNEKTKKCEFRFRNSYGAELSDDVKSTLKDDFKQSTFWVSEELLEKHMTSITALTDK